MQTAALAFLLQLNLPDAATEREDAGLGSGDNFDRMTCSNDFPSSPVSSMAVLLFSLKTNLLHITSVSSPPSSSPIQPCATVAGAFSASPVVRRRDPNGDYGLEMSGALPDACESRALLQKEPRVFAAAFSS